MSDEQTVATETDVSAMPETEESGAQDDLDTLLSEYDKASTSSPDEQQKSDQPDVNEVLAYVKQKQEEEYRTQTRQDLDSAVKAIKEGLDASIPLPDYAVRGMLHAKAEDDPRVLKAWQNRHQDKASWGRVLKAMSKEFSKEFSNLPDKGMTDDREAVAAAVRGASTSRPQTGDFNEKDVRKMNANQLLHNFPDLAG